MFNITSQLEQGYVRVERVWQADNRIELELAMPIERMYANPSFGSNELHRIHADDPIECLFFTLTTILIISYYFTIRNFVFHVKKFECQEGKPCSGLT